MLRTVLKVKWMSQLSIKHIFGVESNCIYYLNEYCYVYPSNRHIIIYNIDSKCQYLIPYENSFDKFKLLTVSPNKEYLGIVLNPYGIILYDIKKLKQREKKILLLKQKINSNDIFSLIFSNNSKYLLAL